MKDIISSVFSHEIKNSLASIKFGLEMFIKYDIDKKEIKEQSKELLNTITNTISILEEYISFIKFQFTKKLKYEKFSIYSLLLELKSELIPFAEEKKVNIYIQKNDITLYNNYFWLKRAIHNIIFNAIKYNRPGGNINIKAESSLFGVYLSISDTGIGIERKKLKSIFRFFERIDENSKGFGVGLALSKSVIETIGGQISVKSNENIGTEFILYIPFKPKEVTLKKIASGIVAASVLLFFGISYFPIYSQNYTISNNGGYISYLLEDGSVVKFDENAKYEISFKKNLYNTKYSLDSKIFKGVMSLKAIKTKAKINIDEMEFENLGTDFEIAKDDSLKVAVFEGAVKSPKFLLHQKEGIVVTDMGVKKVILLDKVKELKIQKGVLSFKDNPKAIKYQLLFSKDKNFSKIEKSFSTTKTHIVLKLDDDTLYYIKVFAYDENELPSIPNEIEFINLSHYYNALKLEKDGNYNEAMLELQNSVSTIKSYSSLPYFEIAKLYFRDKNYNKAIFYLKKAIDIDKRLDYLKLLANSYIKVKNMKELEKVVNLILKTYREDIDCLYYKALLLKDKNQKEAQKYLFRLLQLKPNDKKANSLMGEILEKLGKKDLANYYKGLAK